MLPSKLIQLGSSDVAVFWRYGWASWVATDCKIDKRSCLEFPGFQEGRENKVGQVNFGSNAAGQRFVLLPCSKPGNGLELSSGCLLWWWWRLSLRGEDKTMFPFTPLSHNSSKMARATEDWGKLWQDTSSTLQYAPSFIKLTVSTQLSHCGLYTLCVRLLCFSFYWKEILLSHNVSWLLFSHPPLLPVPPLVPSHLDRCLFVSH